MPEMDPVLAEVIRRAEAVHALAERGYSDLVGPDPSLRWAGVHNVAVFGRSVTLALQVARRRLKDRFDSEWYQAASDGLASWEHAKKWRDLRNEVLKEGPPEGSVTVTINSLDSTDINDLVRRAPPGATKVFIGDRNGGSGWEIETADGVIERFYAALPDGLDGRVHIQMMFPGTDADVAALAREYLDKLGALIAEAKRYFESVS